MIVGFLLLKGITLTMELLTRLFMFPIQYLNFFCCGQCIKKRKFCQFVIFPSQNSHQKIIEGDTAKKKIFFDCGPKVYFTTSTHSLTF